MKVSLCKQKKENEDVKKPETAFACLNDIKVTQRKSGKTAWEETWVLDSGLSVAP